MLLCKYHVCSRPWDNPNNYQLAAEVRRSERSSECRVVLLSSQSCLTPYYCGTRGTLKFLHVHDLRFFLRRLNRTWCVSHHSVHAPKVSYAFQTSRSLLIPRRLEPATRIAPSPRFPLVIECLHCPSRNKARIRHLTGQVHLKSVHGSHIHRQLFGCSPS